MKRSNDEISSRRHEILRVIEREQDISIVHLNSYFDISVPTLRRDLDALAAQNLVLRYHGGVRYAGRNTDLPVFDNKLLANREEKQCIASYLASILPTGSTIFMNGGTSTLEIIRSIKNHNATIITNNVLAFEAAEGGSSNIISTGGEYNCISKTYSGELSNAILQKTFADYCILGVNGINSRDGITTSVYSESVINGLMAQRCRGPIIIAADASKIGKAFCFTSLKLDLVSELVTTSQADPEELEAIAEHGVKVTFADKH